jgi:hypothetical protein
MKKRDSVVQHYKRVNLQSHKAKKDDYEAEAPVGFLDHYFLTV